MHHFVNGGGGAYLSFGTALAWPDDAGDADWALLSDDPTRSRTRSWRRRRCGSARSGGGPSELGAWPFSAEWLSAAFDYNVAPFFQSFVEVRVEPSAGRVRLLPWGVHGRLRWSDLVTSPGLRPDGVRPESPVEWTLPLSARAH